MGSCTHSITSLLQDRHSTRAYKPDPVPRYLLEEAFSQAQNVASNSNLQPWRVMVLEGEALQRVERRLLAAVESGKKPAIKPIPTEYSKYPTEMRRRIYGPDGYNIPREATPELEKARRRNFRFFDAPAGLIVSIDTALAHVDILSVGLWLQALTMLLQERGIASCIQLSIAAYPEELRLELDIPDHMDVLCGVAIGYEDETHCVSKVPQSRDDWRDDVKFVDT